MATDTCTFDVLYIIYFYIIYIMHYMFACVYVYIKNLKCISLCMCIYVFIDLHIINKMNIIVELSPS